MPGAIVSKLTVEVLGDDHGLYPGTVLDVKPENATVYLKFEHDWRPEAWYPCDGTLWEAPAQRNIEDIRHRLAIPGGLVEVLYRVKQGAPEAWYQGVLVSEAKGLFTVDLQLTPQRRVHSAIEQMRTPQAKVAVSPISIFKVAFPVPDGAVNEATDERHLTMFSDFGKFDYVRYDPDLKIIVVMVYGKAGVHRAEILADMHLTHAMHRQNIRDEIAKLKLEHFGPDVSDISGSCRAEFVVPLQYLNRVVGNQYCNVVRARQLPGIVRVLLDSRTGHITIIAANEDALKQAQESLDVVKDVVYIEQFWVGHIIGRSGTNINEITRTANLLGLTLCDNAEQLASFNLPFEWRDGFVPAVLTGLRVDTDAAKMLIEYQVDHNREMEEERRVMEEERRQRLGQERRGDRPFQHPQQQQRGQFSRQQTDERESVDGGVVGGGKLSDASLNGRQESSHHEQQQTLPVAGRSHEDRVGGAPHQQQQNRGGYPPRRDERGQQQGQFNGRRDQQAGFGGPRRDGGPREDKRNGHGEAEPASKDWPELGGDAGRRSSGQGTEGEVARKDAPRGSPNGVVQNGGAVEINGHPEGRRPINNAPAGPGGGGGGRGGGRSGSGRNRGIKGNSQPRSDNDGGVAAVARAKPHTDGQTDLPNGQLNGLGGGEDVDGEGFKPVTARGKRGGNRGQRGGGNGVANGIRPAPEEPPQALSR
ncbi:putative Fragile X mental retardation syndrome-related protein 1 [Hypsibius exemplaris]|uniref:Fragile X mental retardation syndrome-related protein 1 n=1 Tax=Hypsibius exemplaris TaxID=2072580 RepID=A0A1W0WFY5_HYPEX|nr:putative Fragile X mental retardation syndrome-related protein 1 [Hypsibius exemplaris]